MQGSCHPACPAAGLVGKTKTRKMTLRTVPLHTSRVRFTSAVASSLYLPGQVKAPSSCPDPRLLSKRTSPRCSCAVWASLPADRSPLGTAQITEAHSASWTRLRFVCILHASLFTNNTILTKMCKRWRITFHSHSFFDFFFIWFSK